jgi:WD40 repeat protein
LNSPNNADDKTCRLLSLLTTESIPQKFASSVVAVDSAQDKLLVGEQNGQLHMFDLRQDTNTTAIKFHTEKPEPVLEQEDEFSIGFGNTTKPIAPLRDAHIHPLNEHLVGGVAGNHYFLWDLRNPGTTLDHNVAHMPGAKHFRWAPTNDHTFATASGFDTIKIWKANNGKNASLLQTHKQDYRVGGLAWTNYKVGNDEDVLQAKKSEPLCCVSGGDRKLHFYVTF